MPTEKLQTKDNIVKSISSIWNLLNDEEQAYLYKRLTFREYKKNEIIYSEGQTPEQLMCLVSGKVKIYKTGIGSRSPIMRVIQPVQYFGYRAYFASEPYVTNACALENSLTAFIPMKSIEHVLESNSSLGLYFIRLLSVDLGISDKRSISLTQSHIRGRLSETLLFLKSTYGLEEDGTTLSIYLSREDLAALSNMTTANAIRTLSNFSSEKLVAIDGRKIKIIDEPRLRRIADMG